VADALRAVADHRDVPLVSLAEDLDGYADIGQAGWAAWRTRLQLVDLLPGSFADVLTAVIAFAEPILVGTVVASATWSPFDRSWTG